MSADAAVEAGARAWFARTQAHRRDPGAKDLDGNPHTWDSLTDSDKAGYVALAKEIVLPALLAYERCVA